MELEPCSGDTLDPKCVAGWSSSIPGFRGYSGPKLIRPTPDLKEETLPCPIVGDCSLHTVQTADVGVADGSGFASSSHTDAPQLGDPSSLMACLRLHAGPSQRNAEKPSTQDMDGLSDEVVNTSAATLV